MIHGSIPHSLSRVQLHSARKFLRAKGLIFCLGNSLSHGIAWQESQESVAGVQRGSVAKDGEDHLAYLQLLRSFAAPAVNSQWVIWRASPGLWLLHRVSRAPGLPAAMLIMLPQFRDPLTAQSMADETSSCQGCSGAFWDARAACTPGVPLTGADVGAK